jgi:hypothetical protein
LTLSVTGSPDLVKSAGIEVMAGGTQAVTVTVAVSLVTFPQPLTISTKYAALAVSGGVTSVGESGPTPLLSGSAALRQV